MIFSWGAFFEEGKKYIKIIVSGDANFHVFIHFSTRRPINFFFVFFFVFERRYCFVAYRRKFKIPLKSTETIRHGYRHHHQIASIESGY